MTYPLLLQAIQRIDEQYRSSRITKMLKEEKVFRLFQWLVTISIAFAFISIFILQLLDDCPTLTIVWVTIHTLLTWLLLVTTILLVYTIMTYYNPDELLDRINNLRSIGEAEMEKDNSYLLEIFDIAKYAVSIEDEKVYRRAKDMLLEELYAYIQEQLNSKKTKKRGICFTEVQIDLMKQVLNMTCKSDNNFFSHDSFLINIWFFPTQYVPISEDTWQIIWNFVTQVVDAGNEEWFLSYWTFAEQFYRFYLEDRYDIDASVSKQKSIFKQFHLALGAYLWHKGKYNLLKQILYFTQTLPPSYPLMDNTLIEIFNDIKRIYDLKEHPLELTKRYMMSDMVNDVHSDVYIARMFNSYFALLMLRLKDMDYNVSYCDSQSFPLIDPDSSIQGLNEQIKHADILLYFLNDKDFTNKSQKIGYNSDDSHKSKDLLKGYKSEVEKAIKEKVENPKPDPQKINYIKQQLLEEINNQKLYLPIEQDSKLGNINVSRESFYTIQSLEVPKEDIAKYMDRISANMEEALVSSLLIQEQQQYNRFFLLNKPVIKYTVRFKDLMVALERLKVNDKHIILSMGVYLGTFIDLYGEHPLFSFSAGTGSFNQADIRSIPSSMRVFVIMLEEVLPYVEHTEMDSKESNGLKCIDTDSWLYSNVDTLTAKNNVLTVKRKVNLVHNANFTKYVMLKVEYNNDSSVFDIDKIESIDHFI